MLIKQKNIIYIGHLPHGFYENELLNYFSQFGTVLKVRVARNRKTGMSKGYGFIQFKVADVAEIAASAMNNYLMFDKIIKCHVLPKEKVRKELFKGIKLNKSVYYNTKEYSKQRLVMLRKQENNFQKTQKTIVRSVNRRKSKMANLAATLSKADITFQYKPIINSSSDCNKSV